MLLIFILLPIIVFCDKLSPSENEDIQRACGRSNAGHKKRHIALGPRVLYASFQQQSSWVVSISYHGIFLCTGSLISRRHVLTAAHCFAKIGDSTCKDDLRHETEWSNTEVGAFRVKVDSITSEIHTDLEKTHNVKQVTFPASFTKRQCPTYNNQYEDIAILELIEDIHSPAVSFACLPANPFSNGKLTMYGYGDDMEDNDHTLRMQEMTKTDNCPIEIEKYTAVICLKGTDGSLGCQGDSGASVFTKSLDGRTESVGVLSAGFSCSQDKEERNINPHFSTPFDEVITELYPYVNWICKWTGICVQGATEHDERPTNQWNA